MRRIGKFVAYTVTRMVVLALISWGISAYLVRDPKHTPTELLKTSNSGLEQVARALR